MRLLRLAVKDIEKTRVFYHGAYNSFEVLKRGEDKILWLTDRMDIAELYSNRYESSGYSPYIWEVVIKDSVKLCALWDLENPHIREIKDLLNKTGINFGSPISDDSWDRWADFGILEGHPWVSGFLKSKKYAGVFVHDTCGSTLHPHDSLALFNLSAISSSKRIK